MLEVRRGETMSIVDKYIHYVNQEVKNGPEKSWDWMVRGFQANKLKTRLLPKKGLSKGYQKLEAMMMSLVADSLSHGEAMCGEIFLPPVRSFSALISAPCPSNAFPAIFPGIIWKIILLTVPRTQGWRRPCVLIIRPLPGRWKAAS